MKPVTAATPSRPMSERSGWSERSSRLFIELQRPARGMVRRAFRSAFSDDEIDDIYAGAWLGVLRALATRHRKLSDDEVRSYVFTAVAHQAGKELRRRRRKPTAPLELVGAVPDGADGPEEQAAGAEESRVTRDLLVSLPPRRRAVMLLRYGWGLEPQQVCGLVPGLSPRAYRKEITRGVDELTEKMRAFERGEWCDDREQVLKAYAAGLADVDQRRQAKAHLSHCQECTRFVAGLSRHLFDLGALAAPAAMQVIGPAAGGGIHAIEIGDRIREAAANASTRAGQAQEALLSSAAGAGARGGGSAGAGVLAKLAGIGVSGKVALACVSGGVAATACIAAGFVPLSPSAHQQPTAALRSDAKQNTPRAQGVVAAPVPVVAEPVDPTPTGQGAGDVSSAIEPRSEEPDPEPAAHGPVSEAPPATQEFGVEAAAVASGGGAPPATVQSGSDAGAGSEVQQEFGGP